MRAAAAETLLLSWQHRWWNFKPCSLSFLARRIRWKWCWGGTGKRQDWKHKRRSVKAAIWAGNRSGSSGTSRDFLFDMGEALWRCSFLPYWWSYLFGCAEQWLCHGLWWGSWISLSLTGYERGSSKHLILEFCVPTYSKKKIFSWSQSPNSFCRIIHRWRHWKAKGELFIHLNVFLHVLESVWCGRLSQPSLVKCTSEPSKPWRFCCMDFGVYAIFAVIKWWL